MNLHLLVLDGKAHRTVKILSLNEYIRTQKLDAFVSAALGCCLPFMEELRTPSNAMKLKYDIHRVFNVKWALLVKEDLHGLQA